MIEVKQSTSRTIPVGPFADIADGTVKALTLSTVDSAYIVKAGASSGVDVSSNTWAAITSTNMYNLTLTSSNTDTLGTMRLAIVDDSEIVPYIVDINVLPAHVYDSRYGSDYQQVDLVQVSGDATRVTNFAAGLDSMVTGAAVSGTLSTTQMSTDLTETTDDHYNGCTIKWTSGVLADQCTDITDYNGSTKVLTYTAVTEAPSAADAFVIL